MSSVELLTVVLGLVVGYGIIAGLMNVRTSSQAPSEEQEAAAEPHHQGQPAGGRTEGLSPEWIRANWHEVLGVSPNASTEVIKSAYRLRAQQYHPGNTERLGPELKALAAQKMQELNLAYTWATRAQRGR
jgi:DnaJ-domain-containing protein 1